MVCVCVCTYLTTEKVNLFMTFTRWNYDKLPQMLSSLTFIILEQGDPLCLDLMQGKFPTTLCFTTAGLLGFLYFLSLGL